MKATMKAARCSFHFRPFHVSSVLSLCMLIEDAYRATEINWNVMISTEMKWTPCAPAFMSSHFCRSVRRVRILNILKFFYWVFLYAHHTSGLVSSMKHREDGWSRRRTSANWHKSGVKNTPIETYRFRDNILKRTRRLESTILFS